MGDEDVERVFWTRIFVTEEYLSSEVFFTECFDEDVLKFILDRLYFLSVEQNMNTH